MRNKMDQTCVPETNEEAYVKKVIGILDSSQEVEDLLSEMRQVADEVGVDKLRTRVKRPNSAIRTFRIRQCKSLEDMNDVIGVHFITENVQQVVDKLTPRFPNADHVDFMEEEWLYSPLVYTKKCPAISYHLLMHESIEGVDGVPIEVRICSKESFISEQSVYYTVYKNDDIKMPMKEKNNLRNKLQHIVYKLDVLSMREMSEEDREKHTFELRDLISRNAQLLSENAEVFRDVISELGMLTYKFEHDAAVEADKRTVPGESLDAIDDKLKEIFSTIFRGMKEGDFISKVQDTIEQMRSISYGEVRDGIVPEDVEGHDNR